MSRGGIDNSSEGGIAGQRGWVALLGSVSNACFVSKIRVVSIPMVQIHGGVRRVCQASPGVQCRDKKPPSRKVKEAVFPEETLGFSESRR